MPHSVVRIRCFATFCSWVASGAVFTVTLHFWYFVRSITSS